MINYALNFTNVDNFDFMRTINYLQLVSFYPGYYFS